MYPPFPQLPEDCGKIGNYENIHLKPNDETLEVFVICLPRRRAIILQRDLS